MSSDLSLEAVKKILEPLLVDDIFLVEMKVKPTNNIKIFLDADSGLGIEKCIKINRALYRQIEEQELYPDGNFSLEVSSPGLDEPLKMQRQYVKNLGREAEVTLQDERRLLGTMKAVTDDELLLEITEGKGKKAIMREEHILFKEIKTTKIQIKF